MAKIYGNSDGKIIRVLCTSREEAMYPDPPEDSVYSIDLDQYENADLLRDVAALQKDYSLMDNVLSKKGSAIPIVPDGVIYQDEKTLVYLKEQLLAGNALTHQDLTTLVKYVFTKLGI